MGQKQPKSDRSQPEFMFVFSSKAHCNEGLSSTTRRDESRHLDLEADEVKSVRRQLLDELHELGC